MSVGNHVRSNLVGKDMSLDFVVRIKLLRDRDFGSLDRKIGQVWVLCGYFRWSWHSGEVVGKFYGCHIGFKKFL